MTVRTRVVEGRSGGGGAAARRGPRRAVAAAGSAEVLVDGARRLLLDVAVDHVWWPGGAVPGAPVVLFGRVRSGSRTVGGLGGLGRYEPARAVIGSAAGCPGRTGATGTS
jgi:hypothetical protein